MTLQNKANELAKSLGASIDIPEYCEHDRSYTVQAVAPDGKQWAAAQSLHLVSVWYTYVKGDKNAAFEDLINRMRDGLEELDEEINPQ